MTDTLSRPPLEVVERPYTAADLAELPSELPSGTARYELDNGRLITMAPPGDEHGAIESVFAAELRIQGQRRGFGKARCGEVGIVLWRNPDRVVGADAAFISTASLPVRRSPEGYLETIPELVVEVRGKTDTAPYVQRKVDDYLAAGVRVVWVADPRTRTVTAHRADAGPAIHAEGDVLTVEDVIPGFRLPVAEVFED